MLECVSIEVSVFIVLFNLKSFIVFIEKSMYVGLGVFIDNVGLCLGNIWVFMNLLVWGIKFVGGLIKYYDE